MKINRNISVVLLILSILLFNSTACTEQVKLQNFTSNTGRFSLMVPSIPKIDSVTLSEEGITVTVKTFIIDQKSNGKFKE